MYPMRLRSQVFAITSVLIILSPARVFAATYGSGDYGQNNYGEGADQLPLTVVDNGPGIPIPQAQGCDASKPGSAPVLFQITPANTSQTLYFTPASNADRYFIQYGTKSDSYTYGFEIKNTDNGVIAVAINALLKNTTYYYQVRGGNGCATGAWSNELSAKTGSGKTSYRWTAITPIAKSTIQKKIAKKEVLSLQIEAPTATLAPEPSATPLPQRESVQPSTPKPATGFWAFIKRLFGR